jgi:hypothetical protein
VIRALQAAIDAELIREQRQELLTERADVA